MLDGARRSVVVLDGARRCSTVSARRCSTLLDVARRYGMPPRCHRKGLMVLDGARRCSTVLDGVWHMVLDVARRCSTVSGGARRCSTLLDGTRRQGRSTLLDVARRCSTLPDVVCRCLLMSTDVCMRFVLPCMLNCCVNVFEVLNVVKMMTYLQNSSQLVLFLPNQALSRPSVLPTHGFATIFDNSMTKCHVLRTLLTFESNLCAHACVLAHGSQNVCPTMLS